MPQHKAKAKVKVMISKEKEGGRAIAVPWRY
jgi:hypothetical protein